MADLIPTADVRAMLEAATPGPWRFVSHPPAMILAANDPGCVGTFPMNHGRFTTLRRDDAALIAAAPTLARELIAAREERDKAEERADSDVARMQQVVYDALVSGVKAALPDADIGRIDGAGSDGDEFEFTEAEVSIALSMLDDALTELRAERDAAREERDAAIDRRDFTTEWYATRIKTLEEWAKREGHWPTIACILANDAESTTAPSSYAQLLAMTEHRAIAAKAERARLARLLAHCREAAVSRVPAIAEDQTTVEAVQALALAFDAATAERDRVLRDFTGLDAAEWDEEGKVHAEWMRAENRAGGVVTCPDCGKGWMVDGTADVDLSPRRCLGCEHKAVVAERDRLRQELADLRVNVRRFDPLAGENGYRHHKDGSRCLDPECRRAHALPAADRAAKGGK